MKAVVPAAGEGTRLQPLTATTPKPLVEVAGKPLLAHVFETLIPLEVTEIVAIIGYEGEQIRDEFGGSFRGIPVRYVKQHDRLGLAHAISQARSFIDDTFLLLNGDNVFVGELPPLVTMLKAGRVDGMLLIERGSLDDARLTGVVETANGLITRVVEKPADPPSRRITTGCYVLPRETIAACEAVDLSDRGEYELADALNCLIEQGHRFDAVAFEGWRRNVNTPADIDAVERRLRAEGR